MKEVASIIIINNKSNKFINTKGVLGLLNAVLSPDTILENNISTYDYVGYSFVIQTEKTEAGITITVMDK